MILETCSGYIRNATAASLGGTNAYGGTFGFGMRVSALRVVRGLKNKEGNYARDNSTAS